jgi:hypothetical protein
MVSMTYLAFPSGSTHRNDQELARITCVIAGHSRPKDGVASLAYAWQSMQR